MAAAGMLDKQISSELGISPNTLRTYWTRIRGKLGQVTRSAIVAGFVSASNQGDEGAEIPQLDHEGWILDVPSMTMVASDAVNDLHGLQRGVPHPALEYSRLYHPEDRDATRKVLYDVIEGRIESAHLVFRLAIEGGVELVHLTVSAIRAHDGSVKTVYGYRTRSLDCRPGRDPGVQIGHWERNFPDKEVWIDDDLAEMAGLDRAGVVPIEDLLALLDDEDREELSTRITAAIESKEELVQNEARYFKPDGSVIWTRTTRRFYYQDDGRVKIVGTVIRFT